jgi:hypothetical protein
VRRYDTMALKSLDVFSIHGFPVAYVQVESNLLGIRNGHCDAMNALATADEVARLLEHAEIPQRTIAGTLFGQEKATKVANAVAF